MAWDQTVPRTPKPRRPFASAALGCQSQKRSTKLLAEVSIVKRKQTSPSGKPGFSWCVRVCVRVHAHMRLCACRCLCVHVHMRMCVQVCAGVHVSCVHMCVHACVHVCARVCVLCASVCMHACVCARSCVCVKSLLTSGFFSDVMPDVPNSSRLLIMSPLHALESSMAKCNSVPERGTGVYRLYLVWKVLEPVGDQKESVSFNISQGELGSQML